MKKLKDIFFGIIVVSFFLSWNFLGGMIWARSTSENSLILKPTGISFAMLPFTNAKLQVYKNGELITDNVFSPSLQNFIRPVELPLDFESEGIYQIRYILGEKISVKEFTVDHTAPQISLNYSPLTKETVAKVGVTLNEPGSIMITGSQFVKPQKVENNTVSVELLEGENSFTIIALDRYNNINTEKFSISLDTTAPQISLLSPLDPDIYANTINLQVKATDNNPISKISINGTDLVSTDKEKYSAPFTVTNGENKFLVLATDSLGNSGEQELNLKFSILAPIKVPILMYHHVDGGLYENNDLKPQLFEEQLKFLKNQGWTTIGFKDLDDHLLNGKKIPKKSIILSFDDGYIDNYNNAFRLLKQYNMKGSFGIITNLVGVYAHDRRWYLSWEEVKEMSDEGMEIVSHSYDHKFMTKINDTELERQLKESKQILEKNTGKSVTTFVYPTGAYNEHVIGKLREYGYTSARISGGTGTPNLNNIYKLPVIRISWNNDGNKLAELLQGY